MADRITRKQRSFIMSRIRSKWTTPEKIMHNFLKGNKIRHKMHPKIEGSPDITLKDEKIAIFLHGCFWHGCKKCYRKPQNNKDFWKDKVKNNRARDKRNEKALKSNGWEVITIWEHDTKKDKLKKLLIKENLLQL